MNNIDKVSTATILTELLQERSFSDRGESSKSVSGNEGRDRGKDGCRRNKSPLRSREGK